MPRKKKGELPSGRIRRQIYDHSELMYDKSGHPIIDPKTGKQKKKRIYISVTADTVNEVNLLKAKIKSNKKIKHNPSNMTLREAIDKYIASSDAILSPTTISGYKIIQKYAFQDIMDTKLNKITNDLLREAVNQEAKRPKTHSNNKSITISPKTVSNEYGLVTAVINEYTNIDCTVKLPQKENKIKELPSPEDVFAAIKGSCIELPALLAMWLSFSMSEIRGLTKSKSIHEGYITITEVTVRVNREDITKPQAKRFTRNRKHRIPDYIMDLINKIETDQLVPCKPHYINYHFQKCIANAGLSHMTFHDLSHMNASIMSVLHIPEKYAMERGGWSSDKVMKKVYTHTFSDERTEADNLIDEYFNTKIVNSSNWDLQLQEKYKSWLVLFDQDDNDTSKEKFIEFMKNATQNGTKK